MKKFTTKDKNKHMIPRMMDRRDKTRLLFTDVAGANYTNHQLVLIGLIALNTLGTTRAIDQNTVFKSVPGDVMALEGGTVFLNWTTALPPEDIEWCYWEFAECDGCASHDLLGYHPQHGGRQNMTSKHQGWRFVEASSPCQGGLKREKIGMEHGGLYWKRVIINGVFMRSEPSELQVFHEHDLYADIRVDDGHKAINMADGKHKPVELDPIIGENRTNISVELSNKFPASGNVDVAEKSSEGLSFTIPQCCRSAGKICEFAMTLGHEKNVSIYFRVYTGIQGYPDIFIHQPYAYTCNDCDSNDNENKSEGWYIVGPMLIIVILFIIAVMIFFCMRYKAKYHKVKRNQGQGHGK